MEDKKSLTFLANVLRNMPQDWLRLTTHRLDIYVEKYAKTQFLEQFEALYETDNAGRSALSELSTAYDYIRLGHPLSSLLEWGIADVNGIPAQHVISFSSRTIAILAVLRKNLFDKKNTRIIHSGPLPADLDTESLRREYGYNFTLEQVRDTSTIGSFDGSTVLLSDHDGVTVNDLSLPVDFFINVYDPLGSVILINGTRNAEYIGAIQHVRRRETIAMTPADSLTALHSLIQGAPFAATGGNQQSKQAVVEQIAGITGSPTPALVGSSGLSVQYAIMMGLVQDALDNHPGKAIKFIVPPNCYGGTNDQARRVAACLDNVEVVDLPVDGGNDMVQGINEVLDRVAALDAVPYIIAEIPTNPRVEVPDLEHLREALSKARFTPSGARAVDPVFILDQTFCPNVQFLGEGKILSTVRTISYASGSKFPSGGKCTAGYCVGNTGSAPLMDKIDFHLQLCDNEATGLQLDILAEQLPSMLQRIDAAYQNTREFVTFIEETLPEAKINFVSEELAAQGFTPSVFSLDLPTQGATAEEKEAYKRSRNLQLINLMITEIPEDSKYCVSYGQLKGCYWTIPATSTQGTTKEGDKDYIVRASLSPDMDMERHKEVFRQFIAS